MTEQESLKLVSLNVWGGKRPGLLHEFFVKHKGKIDVFCLQEMNNFAEDTDLDDPQRTPDLLSQVDDILEEYQYFFRPSIEQPYGQATFVRKDLKVKGEADVFVSGERSDGIEYGGRKDHARNMQYLQIEHAGREFFVHNLHGMWSKHGKVDTPRRIAQSKKIAEHINRHEKPVILCGDFNILPNTKSMQIIESTGLRNLIKEYEVTSTRTSLYDGDEAYADYILISEDIAIKDFRVLPEEVSDHAPLFLEFAV